jgi:riboflavin biosynthesis pyrimidine reductase
MIELLPITMRGLFPAGEEVDFGRLLEELLRSPRGRRRPYVACAFISTLDGRATIAGRTEALGFHMDARVLMRLRTFADAIVIGANTMRVERYDRMLPVQRLREYREQIGLPADPLTVIVSRSLDLPWDAGLFTDGHGEVVIATTSQASPPPTATSVELIRHRGEVDLSALLARLHRERGVETVSCEGGPTVLRNLVADGLVDDLFLTHNPILTGDGERSLLHGTLPAPVPAELLWVLEGEGELFTRWRVKGPRSGEQA